MSVERLVREVVRRFKKGKRIEDFVREHGILFDEKYDERLDEHYLVSLLESGHIVDVVYSYKRRYLSVFVGKVDGETASKSESGVLGFRERASVRG